VSARLRVSPEIADALERRAPVVCLETTLVAHGFPQGEGYAVGASSEAAVRAAGAIPATVGILAGTLVVGLDDAELRRFSEPGANAHKVGARDLAACCVQGALGATTVGGTLAAVRPLGIEVMATGGLGGVHRGFPSPPDISSDLAELARTRVVIVSCGVKSLLDVPATSELLETLGIPVLGYRTDTLPLFYAAAGGPPVSARVESAGETAAVARAHWELGAAGAVALARPPEPSLDDVEPLIEAALAEAVQQAVRGPAITPFVLARLHARSDGRTLRANRELIVGNASLAGEVAVALASAA
jgi:pseudouridine-5'-phosphate glycosidase